MDSWSFKNVKRSQKDDRCFNTEKFCIMIHRVAKNFGIIMAGQDGMIE